MKKYELIQVQGKDIVIDISQLFREEVLYVNVTKLAKQFGKTSQALYSFLNSEDTSEYIAVLEKSYKLGVDTIFKKNPRGKYAGTYAHHSILIYVLRWVDTEFAVKCDIYIRGKIQEAHDEKTRIDATISANKANEIWNPVRERGKIARATLTDAIKAFCAYAVEIRGKPYLKKNGEPKVCPYFIHFTNLSYKKLGLTKTPRELDRRDVFHIGDIERLEALEQEIADIITGAIDTGDDYHELYKQIKREVA